MQHVLRCWERQSDGSEYKKTLRRPTGAPPRTPLRELTALPQTPYLLAVPSSRTPSPHSRPFGPRFSYPHSKISSDAVAEMSLLLFSSFYGLQESQFSNVSKCGSISTKASEIPLRCLRDAAEMRLLLLLWLFYRLQRRLIFNYL